MGELYDTYFFYYYSLSMDWFTKFIGRKIFKKPISNNKLFLLFIGFIAHENIKKDTLIIYLFFDSNLKHRHV
jgi:hypothetical protein